MREGAAKRRWFRFAFSLRTLFVLVTVACALSGWLACNSRAIHYRTVTADKIRSRGGYVEWGWIHQVDLERLPFIWRLQGAEPMFQIFLPRTQFTRQEAVEIQDIFPDSFVSRCDRIWPTPEEGGDRSRPTIDFP